MKLYNIIYNSDTQFSGKYNAEQSDDGYQIVVKFKSEKFYSQFWQRLQKRYPDTTFRYSSDNSRVSNKTAQKSSI